MGNGTEHIEMLKEDMDRLKAEKPFVATLIDALGPVLINERTLKEKIAHNSFTLSPDKLKVMGGVPLIKDYPLFFSDDPWQDFALSMASAIREGFPHLIGDMDRLTTLFRENPQVIAKLFPLAGSPVADEMPAWIADSQIEPAALVLLVNAIKRSLLAARAEAAAEEIKALSWNKGYCPFCGSFPMLAFLRVNGQRWLHCACCHHEWTYPRPQCPHCEHETPDDTTYLFIEEDKDHSAFLCEKCRRYLITVNRGETIREMDPDLTAIGLAHLDVILQGKGYLPMAEREWNNF